MRLEYLKCKVAVERNVCEFHPSQYHNLTFELKYKVAYVCVCSNISNPSQYYNLTFVYVCVCSNTRLGSQTLNTKP
jgi:hypothetical protein